MTPDLFDYSDYKKFLRDQVEANRATRGYLTQLAQAAHCNKSYLSQVLRTKVQLTPEHAAGLSRFWDLNEPASEYFLNLVHLGRTDLPLLKEALRRRLAALKRDQEDLAKRFARSPAAARALDGARLELRESIYHSSWTYAAIHILLSIPGHETPSSIARRLSLPIDLVREQLLALEGMGAARREGGAWALGGGSVHLPKDSPMTTVNHLSWRQRACLNPARGGESLHYTSVQSLSRADFEALRRTLLSTLDRMRAVIEPSPPEELVGFNLDFFRI